MRDSIEDSLPDLVSRVVDDAKEVARAEVDLVKAKASAKITAYRSATILFVVAGLLAFVGLIGLIVGLILVIATLVGPGLATLIVIGAVLAIAGFVGWLGARRWSQG